MTLSWSFSLIFKAHLLHSQVRNFYLYWQISVRRVVFTPQCGVYLLNSSTEAFTIVLADASLRCLYDNIERIPAIASNYGRFWSSLDRTLGCLSITITTQFFISSCKMLSLVSSISTTNNPITVLSAVLIMNVFRSAYLLVFIAILSLSHVSFRLLSHALLQCFSIASRWVTSLPWKFARIVLLDVPNQP